MYLTEEERKLLEEYVSSEDLDKFTSPERTACLWDEVEKGKPMGLSCPCPKCSFTC